MNLKDVITQGLRKSLLPLVQTGIKLQRIGKVLLALVQPWQAYPLRKITSCWNLQEHGVIVNLVYLESLHEIEGRWYIMLFLLAAVV